MRHHGLEGGARAQFDSVLTMIAEGFATRRGRRGALVHRDEVNEDSAIESTAGDIFQLGNASWMILQVTSGTVRVADAKGAPPTIPFWLGEAPARSDELSKAVSDLRALMECGSNAAALESGDFVAALQNECAIPEAAAAQIAEHLQAAQTVLGVLPTQDTLVLERFFDESGGMQLVLHAPFGSRINKAWGLALRKRFCRQFNFELQAAATEDAILLSLGPHHSFPLADVFRYLHPATARDVLVQAFLDAPVFKTRWRWNTTISLAVPRNRGGRKVPPPLQRSMADDMMAARSRTRFSTTRHSIRPSHRGHRGDGDLLRPLRAPLCLCGVGFLALRRIDLRRRSIGMTRSTCLAALPTTHCQPLAPARVSTGMIDQVLRRTLAAILVFLSCTAYAQESSDSKPAPTTTSTTTMVLESDSRETRQQLDEVLRRLPPDVGKVLKLDPSLWTNKEYLANYPALAAFLSAHPDVAHSPQYYLESVWVPSDPAPETPSFRLWSRVMETLSIFGAFAFVAIVLTWLIRTGIEQRRWSRLAKTQSEVHNKLMDRFASNEDLLNYIQTPVGKRFLESAPIPLEQPASRPVSAPIGRILWSVQAGLVTLAGGIGMRTIAMSVQKDAAEPFTALGTLAIAVGIGLVVSAGASFLLSRRLGLLRDTLSAETNAGE